MKQIPPLISFITICYNGLDDTCVLIESLRDTISSVSYEIIVVDNASRQDEASLIQERYPFVRTLRSEKNLGFSGGNNLGIQIAQGKYLFLINNDTYLTEDGFGSAAKYIASSMLENDWRAIPASGPYHLKSVLPFRRKAFNLPHIPSSAGIRCAIKHWAWDVRTTGLSTLHAPVPTFMELR